MFLDIFKVACSLDYKRFGRTFSTNLKRGTQLRYFTKVSNSKCPFWANFPQNMKFRTKTNSNMQNSMVMFTFSVFEPTYPFWANLLHKIKVDRLLIRICKTRW